MKKDVSEIENAIMNPQITDVNIGIRTLRKIKIYPLSMGGQLTITGLIEKAISDFSEKNPDGGTELSVGVFVYRLIEENIVKIFELVMDKDDGNVKDMLDDISNDQTSEIVNIVYTLNFKDPYEKNLKSLFGETLGKVFQSEGPSQPSLNDTEDTELKTSTESNGETEESPSDK